MSKETIKVRVSSEKGGFMYGRQRLDGDVFILKPVEHSTNLDENGEPEIISAEQQFSSRWMIRIDSDVKAVEEMPEEIIVPSGMKKDELIQALNDAKVPFTNGLSKKELVVLLEDHQATASD